MGMVAVLIFVAPISLRSQGPFSGVDDSLAKAADALLASASQSSVNGQRDSEKVSSAGFAIPYGPQSRSWSGGPNLAEARVDVLRPVIEPILRSHGVPADLVALVVVESGGRALALSPKGARGLWQLMPDTARRYGLHVDETQDDRLDLLRSTEAAAQYLHDLYAQFGDWKLALAAYNTGEANVGSAISRAHSQNFNQLNNLGMLPLETRNYVPRVLAAMRMFGQASSLAEFRSKAVAIPVFATSNR
jgi:soluble lytic murein transglycosylase-like protein